MKVYKYWAEPKTREDAALLGNQLARAAEYRRELAQIENRARALLRSLFPLAKEDRSPYRAQIHAAQRAATKQARLRARAHRDGALPCAWGTCAMVDDAHDRSQRTTKITSDVTSFVPRDEGLLAIQYQRHENLPRWKPTIASDLVGGADTFVRLSADLVGRPRPRQGLGATGAKKLRELAFRVGSVGKEPVFAHLYTLLHRPLPAARVVWVKLSCRRVGIRQRWSLLVVVDEDTRTTVPQQRADVVGVDIGWRNRDHRAIRVAYWHGSDGAHGELLVPERIHWRKSKSDSLRAIRDRERNETAPRWWAWIATLPVDHPVRAAAVAFVHWTKMGRFVRLFRLWSQADNRVHGDEDAYDMVDRWLRHDRHLLAWESNNRRRMQLELGALVDQFALAMARRYAIVAVEKRGMVPGIIAKDDALDTKDEVLRGISAVRVGLVAPGAVRASLERFGKKYGALYREVEPAWTTITCSYCHVRRDIAKRADLELACDHCGVVEDQDHTAAKNIARIASAAVQEEIAQALAPSSSLGSARKMGPRRTRKAPRKEVLETPGASDGQP